MEPVHDIVAVRRRLRSAGWRDAALTVRQVGGAGRPDRAVYDVDGRWFAKCYAPEATEGFLRERAGFEAASNQGRAPAVVYADIDEAQGGLLVTERARGVVLDRVIVRPLAGRGHLDQVLATFAVILIANETVRLVFGRQPLALDPPGWLAGTVEILPGVPYPLYRLAVILVGLLGMAWFLIFPPPPPPGPLDRIIFSAERALVMAAERGGGFRGGDERALRCRDSTRWSLARVQAT